MSIARHTAYNLVGVAVPVALAIFTVPAYLHLVGPERYGILAIAWLILGYFGLFDLGLGRATTQRIAALRDATQEERQVAFGTALATNVGIGAIGAAVLAPVTWYMFARGISLSPQLREETIYAVPLLALAVPVATTIGVLSGALMGRERFLDTNRIGIVSTALFQLVPLGVAWIIGANMTALLAASIAARLVGLALFSLACRREFGPGAWRRFDRTQLRALLAYGGWVTLTAMFGPFLVVADRFAIGVILNAVAVTIYTVPMQVTMQLGSISGALGNALFPRLAMAEGEEAARLTSGAVAILLACLTPPVLAGVMLMHPALVLWVGRGIGDQAAPVGRILLIAAWLNVFAQIPYVRLQAIGRPDIVAKVLMSELPFYLPALFFGLHHYGLIGAAIVYLLRVAIDLGLLTWFAARRFILFNVIVAQLAIFAAIELFIRYYAPGPWLSIGLAFLLGSVATVPAWMQLPTEARTLLARGLRRILSRFVSGLR